jgi:hypothetical protein
MLISLSALRAADCRSFDRLPLLLLLPIDSLRAASISALSRFVRRKSRRRRFIIARFCREQMSTARYSSYLAHRRCANNEHRF